MLCSKCGKKNADDAKFCVHCGSVAENAVIMNASENQESLRDVRRLKNSNSSLLNLFATILYTILTSFFLFASMTVELVEVIGEAEEIRYLDIGIQAVFGLCLVPMFFITAGLWVNYYQAHKMYEQKTTGFSLINTGVIIRLVINVIAAAALLVCFIELITSTGSYYNAYEVFGINLFADAVNVLAFVTFVAFLSRILPIVYCVFILVGSSNMRKTIKKDKVSKNRSLMGLCIMNYIYVGINVICLLFSEGLAELVNSVFVKLETADLFENVMFHYSASPWLYVVYVLMSASLIMFSINTMIYRSRCRK